LRDEPLLQQVSRAVERALRLAQFGLRLFQVRARHAHIGHGLVARRGHVQALQSRDDFALLYPAAFLHTQPFQAAGRLRRDRRLALRDYIAGSVEHGQRLVRVGERHAGLLHFHRSSRDTLVGEEGRAARNEHDDRGDESLAQRAAGARVRRARGVALDAQFG
jgi:hypothetical protein